MADAIISVVVEKLVDLLQKQARKEIDLLTGVEEKVRNLSKTLEGIQAVLDDAEQRKIKEKTVKLWLQELEDVSYEIEDVLDECSYRILRQEIEGTSIDNASSSTRKPRVCSFIPSSSSCFKQVVVNRDIALKIKEVTGKLDLIDTKKNQLSFTTSSGVASNSQEWKRVQSTSFVDVSKVFGRDFDKNKLVSQLMPKILQNKKNATQILSIIGTGGIGKTTLAQLAYNDGRVKVHFEKRVWVCVSNPFDEIRVAKAIVESLESSSPNLNELDSLLQRIRDSISGKRFLIVLDDVWTEDQMKWEPFKNSLNHGAPGSTILLTTRSKRVAEVAGASVLELDVLSRSESWLLFCQVAFSSRTETKSERIENIGREIVKKCKGLPLAIKTIGSLLRFKNTLEEWQKVMDSKIWELKVAEVEIFPHLYLSYNDLPSPIRRCFSYCAVFPKDVVIEVDELIRIWMAHGYLNSSESEDDMELRGMEYFEHLATHSFFQDFEKDKFGERIVFCEMHDIVHDFAQFLTKRECLIIEGERKGIYCENARHLTCLGSQDTLFDSNVGQPRSFLAANLKLETLTAHLSNSLKLVRVLKLKGCDLRELPKEIGNLIHLRYLDLSYNEELREFPKTVYDLYNLQTLHLRYCINLEELPPEIKKLTNLRHLFIGAIVKSRVEIGEMTCLQTLPNFKVGKEYNNNLQRLKFMFGSSGRVKEDVEEALELPPNLQSLEINYYSGMRLPKCMTSLNNLRDLVIYRCRELTSLSSLGTLPSLEKLVLIGLPILKVVGPAFLGMKRESSSLPSSPAAIGFPKLTELGFYECKEWQKWEDIGPEDDSITVLLPRLRRLSIYDCRKLKALPHRLLLKASSLECIELDEGEYKPSTILSRTLRLAEVIARGGHIFE